MSDFIQAWAPAVMYLLTGAFVAGATWDDETDLPVFVAAIFVPLWPFFVAFRLGGLLNPQRPRVRVDATDAADDALEAADDALEDLTPEELDDDIAAAEADLASLKSERAKRGGYR